MSVNYEQPVISGKQFGPQGGQYTPPSSQTILQHQAGNFPNSQAVQSGANPYAPQQGDPNTMGLPIMSDPAYAIFAANTGLQMDLSRIGIQTQIPEIQRQEQQGQADLNTQQRDATAAADTMASQRGLTRSGMAVQKQADIAGRFGAARQSLAEGSQAKIDQLTAQDQATQQRLAGAGAGQAVNTATNVGASSGALK